MARPGDSGWERVRSVGDASDELTLWRLPHLDGRYGEAAAVDTLFVDGVPYSEHDSVICSSVISMLTGQCFLCVALRKKMCCRCG